MIELEINEATPSLNPLLGQFWAKRHKDRKRWRWLVRAARLAADAFPTAPLQKARITIVRHGRRQLDTDNLYGGTKLLVDSLVREGFVIDDSPDHIELIVTQKLTKTPKTTIRIEALGDLA